VSDPHHLNYATPRPNSARLIRAKILGLVGFVVFISFTIFCVFLGIGFIREVDSARAVCFFLLAFVSLISAAIALRQIIRASRPPTDEPTQ
jgi:cytosine/uracil/thiamine/allantoin permease